MIFVAAFSRLLDTPGRRTSSSARRSPAARTGCSKAGRLLRQHARLARGPFGNPSFLELLARARETALGAYSHAEVPFEKLVADLTRSAT
jgi:hypothetical protein